MGSLCDGRPGFFGLYDTIAPSCLPYSGLIVVSMSRIQGTSSKGAVLSPRWLLSQAMPASSGIANSARRKASSLITLFIPSSPGLTPSQRIVVTCESRRCPDKMDSIQVPSTSALLGAFGLVTSAGTDPASPTTDPSASKTR